MDAVSLCLRADQLLLAQAKGGDPHVGYSVDSHMLLGLSSVRHSPTTGAGGPGFESRFGPFWFLDLRSCFCSNGSVFVFWQLFALFWQVVFYFWQACFLKWLCLFVWQVLFFVLAGSFLFWQVCLLLKWLSRQICIAQKASQCCCWNYHAQLSGRTDSYHMRNRHPSLQHLLAYC